MMRTNRMGAKSREGNGFSGTVIPGDKSILYLD
jgi:hypothetical protein